MQAQVSPLRGGLDGSVAYISCGEGQFPIRRLSQLAKHYEEKQIYVVEILIVVISVLLLYSLRHNQVIHLKRL